MLFTMLVVDSNHAVNERESAAWTQHGIAAERIDTMQQALDRAAAGDYLLITINADTVNYLPLLRFLHDVSNAPVFLIGTDLTHAQQAEALLNGADAVALFSTPDENARLGMALLHSHSERAKRQLKALRAASCGNLTVFAAYTKVFCNDTELILTRKEYDALLYLLLNRNITLTLNQLSRRIWGEDVSRNAVWQVINRLSRKLNRAGLVGSKITNFKGVGYRLSVNGDR